MVLFVNDIVDTIAMYKQILLKMECTVYETNKKRIMACPKTIKIDLA